MASNRQSEKDFSHLSDKGPLSLKLVIKGRCPTWNVVLDMNPFFRKELRYRIQGDVQSALRSIAADSQTHSGTVTSITSTASDTLALSAMIRTQKYRLRKNLMKKLKQKPRSVSK